MASLQAEARELAERAASYAAETESRKPEGDGCVTGRIRQLDLDGGEGTLKPMKAPRVRFEFKPRHAHDLASAFQRGDDVTLYGTWVPREHAMLIDEIETAPPESQLP